MAEGRLRDEWRIQLAARAAAGLQRLMELTYRVRILDRSWAQRRAAGEVGRCIYCSWHSYLWNGMVSLRGQGVCILVSSHRDGEIITRVLERQGFTTVRGSSTRGGTAALRELTRLARDGEGDLLLTVDGPRGPAREIKEGILFAASRTGLPVVPIGLWVDRAWRVRSWDRTVIGKPFARVAVSFGEPQEIPARADRAELLGVHRERLARAMDEAEQRARRALQPHPDP